MATHKKQITPRSAWLISTLILALCILAGFAGAKLQALKSQQAMPVLQAENNTDIIENLAYEVGELRGRLIAIEQMRSSISKSAGLDMNLSELNDVKPIAGVTSKSPVSYNSSVQPSLKGLQTDIHKLKTGLAYEEDFYYFMSLSQSMQNGFHASLPTYKPVKYPELSSSFGWRKSPISGRNKMHEGLDFSAPYGAPIKAASGGVVVFSGRLGGYGNMVEIDHGNGLHTRYGHASSLLVKNGDIVKQGQEIAKVGSTGMSTGAHLHFEVRMADYPLDPSLFINSTIEKNQVFAKNEQSNSANKS